MLTPDVNVLVAAFRADHPHHGAARQWLLGQLKASAVGSRLLLLPMVCVSFVRLVTHRRIFDVPATAEEAFAFVEALLADPGSEMPQLGREWAAFVALCSGKALAGNLVQDAWIAAAARAAGATLVTFDRDFESLLGPHELLLLLPAAASTAAKPSARRS
ncbi:TA system VapC family ribonuclease toxin [Piscinibacter sp.]|uniref:TA system VapC family ribonuclease toxin n=1 Tax=Piscinibacter sp. TaxID=1903157 RepID=UPI002C1E1AF9|nr:TA system VapC family ribonuclease toxin [Albitalea sp.]HUG24368.1 TA system VapC family ribonuclease toxin [Albitalea sp.]